MDSLHLFVKLIINKYTKPYLSVCILIMFGQEFAPNNPKTFLLHLVVVHARNTSPFYYPNTLPNRTSLGTGTPIHLNGVWLEVDLKTHTIMIHF